MADPASVLGYLNDYNPPVQSDTTDDGTLFGLIHGIGIRKRAAAVRGDMQNYLNDPEASIKAVMQHDPDRGISLQNYTTQNALAMRQAQLQAQQAQQARFKTAMFGLTQGLQKAQAAGQDLGTAYDGMAPLLKNGFGMSDADIADWRQRITSNPSILGEIQQSLQEPIPHKFTATRGGDIYDEASGNVVHSEPKPAKSVILKDGNGGEHLFVMDENGNFIQSQQVPGASGGPSVPGAAYSGPKTIDPASRGMRNNNPGNIKDGPWARKQPGYIGTDGTFAKFEPGAGDAAMTNLLSNFYVNGQRSVSDIVDKYLGGTAPGNENSAAARANYKTYVAGRLGIDPSAPVPTAMLPQLKQAMAENENGGAGTSGGGIKPVASTPGKPTNTGWRELTIAEKQARGLDPTRAYQIGTSGANAGKIENVGGQPTANAKGGDPMDAYTTAKTGLSELAANLQKLRDDPALGSATGLQGKVMGILPGSHARYIQGLVDQINSQKMLSLVTSLKASGGNPFNRITNMEAKMLPKSLGNFDLNQNPADLRANINAALQQVQTLQKQADASAQRRGIASGGKALPKVGEVRNGYAYVGGPPASPSSWRKQ